MKLRGIILILAFFSAPLRAEEKPTIISLDYCSDQYVLAIADPSQIIALSPESLSEHSRLRDKARGLPQVRANLEELMILKPDIVVRHWEGDARLIKGLENYGVRVISTDFGFKIEKTLENIEKVAIGAGQIARGEALKADLLKRLRALQEDRQNIPPLKALYVTPGGVTTGGDTMVDQIITEAGFKNMIAEMGISGWVDLPLEKLVFEKPDLIITGFYDHRSTNVDNWTFARHDFLAKMLKNVPTLNLPGSVLSCNGLFMVEAAERLREMLGQLQ